VVLGRAARERAYEIFTLQEHVHRLTAFYAVATHIDAPGA